MGQAWHQDGEYVRLTFSLDDLSPGGGGTQCMPGTHRAALLPGPATKIPDWANSEATVSRPRTGVDLDGADQMCGPAGCCMVRPVT